MIESDEDDCEFTAEDRVKLSRFNERFARFKPEPEQIPKGQHLYVFLCQCCADQIMADGSCGSKCSQSGKGLKDREKWLLDWVKFHRMEDEGKLPYVPIDIEIDRYLHRLPHASGEQKGTN